MGAFRVYLVVALSIWLSKPSRWRPLGVLFFGHVFAGLVPADDAQQDLAGMILLGVTDGRTSYETCLRPSNDGPRSRLMRRE